MMTVTTLIINEVRSRLGHNPTQEELNSLSEYLANKKINFLVDLECAIMDWDREWTTECAWCGDRFLTTIMIHTDHTRSFCCEQCRKDYEEEHGRTTEDDIDQMCEEVGSQDFTQLVAEAVEKDNK